jgi:localization factor PodJL
MRHVPWHVKGVRTAPRDAAGDAARRSGVSVSAAFAMIRKEIQELRRQTSRPQVEPAVFEQRVHELAAQIVALQGMAGGEPGLAEAGPGLDAFIRQLKALLAQNLVALQQQVATTAANAISGPAESIRRDVASLKEIQASVDRRTQDTFEAVYGTIERIVDRLAAIEGDLRERSSGGQADAAPLLYGEADDPAWAGLPAIRSDFVPEAPAPVQMLAPAAGPGGAVMLRRPAVVPDVAAAVPGQGAVRQELARLESAGLESDLPPLQSSAARGGGLVAAARRVGGALVRTTARPLRPQGKSTALGVGVVLLLLFGLTFTLDLYRAPAEPAGHEDDGQARAATPAPDQPPVHHDADKEADKDAGKDISKDANRDAGLNPPPLPDGAIPAPAAQPPEPVTTAAAAPVLADSAPWDVETLMRNVLLPAAAGHAPWPQSGAAAGPDLTAMPLPATIGSKTLIAAAHAGDPGASYEIAIRFAQGRNAATDFARAAAWLDRAAQAGIAPAQFRLGGMYEKGLGVRRDLAEARRLYMAAAAKGHAKAMHNLAVLYTHIPGLDGTPDYGAAVEWFRKAAACGTVDSQYNLGILYARGTGVERDLVEAYKWFALAAKGGDREAGRKRDEVAKGLDPRQLESAKASADAFVTMPQPDEASATRAPAGGWDQMAAAATTKSRMPGRSERFQGK